MPGMNLNPVIIIPTYWSGRREAIQDDITTSYDHATPIDKDGTLGRCLASLQGVDGIGRIVLLVVSTPGTENQAHEKVSAIAAGYPGLDIAVIGQAQLNHFNLRLEQLGLQSSVNCINLRTEGAIRNLGIAMASIFAHDTIVFLDERFVVPGSDFLERAVYGIGAQTPEGSVITAKTGYFLDEEGNYTAPEDVKWYRRSWNSNVEFNAYIQEVMEGPRLTQAKSACGGCMVLHADAYGLIPFDPWIVRGEDLDYVLSGLMYGLDIWFDNCLQVQSLPDQAESDEVQQFRKDVYRWFYENRKIEFAKTQIDLLQISSQALEPYPGPWITKKIDSKARRTAYLSAIGHREHIQYLRAGRQTRKEAAAYARENCSQYFDFQREWPQLVRALWNDIALATQFSGVRSTKVGNPSFTGRLSAVQVNDSPTPDTPSTQD
ncbi:MAG: hypothetical protein LUD25_02040 [Coriobacteriaceae bacterium]|nr:hypothetical protein [Coriobacteriaceae bacterium]